ncbi:MAG: DUF1501 domain-containing protein [Planctomycetaceae bacterium]
MPSRRDLLRLLPAGGLAAGVLGWGDVVSAHAPAIRRRGKACILLWMQGGPSQFETFSPLEGHTNGGGTKAIATSVAGMRFAEHWPEAAQVADRLAVIRSMTSKEGSHPRASYLLHTGYLPNPSARHPTLGSIVASQAAAGHGGETGDLPPVVRIGGRGRNDSGAGLLGMQWEPFEMRDPEQNPVNTKPQVPADRHLRRLDLMDALSGDFAKQLPREARDHRDLYRRATRMIMSADMRAFDLDAEPEGVRAAYGPGAFASGCLLARRLVEHGVSFVEVVSNGWDTHQDNFEKVAELAGQVDRPMAALVRDLESRGLIDDTLVIWMGEFGRTPQVNPRGGRDHFPRSFNAVLAGGGVGGGRVIGRTDKAGVEVADRPVTVPDLFATFCRSLGIDPTVENTASSGRPIKLVDGGKAVEELFAG